MYHKWQSYDAWFLRHWVQQTDFFVILDHFLPFYNHNYSKDHNFEKMKKRPGEIIILHMCTINENHVMYGSWYMECDDQNFLSIWTIFCTFTPLKTRKIKILKKWKKKDTWRYHHFTHVRQRSYAVLFLRYDAWRM